jgi:NAD(P)-dependent dehydrogenase (short-subunit alcohol dehydrogenase family)
MNGKPPPGPGPILITGCSSGIGAHAVGALRDRGWDVIASARNERDVAALAAAGVTAIRIDLDDPSSVAEGAENALALGGGSVGGVFHNAGFGQPGAVEDLPRKALEEQFSTNVFGTAQLTAALIPAMRRQGYGRIVVNSSVLGLIAMPYRGAYNASKFALEGLFDTLRLELAGTGIHVSLIEPGPIASQFRKNSMARFLAWIDREKSPHRERYDAMVSRLAAVGPSTPFTLGPEAVTDALIDALTSDRPRPRYYVTTPTKLFGRLRHVLPTRLMDAILRHPRVSG